MAYRIEYAKEAACRYPQKTKKIHRKTGKLLLLCVVFASALWIRLNGVPDFLIPGDAAVTRAAMAHFVEHVQTGMPVGEAVSTFCQQIIAGAGL